MTLQLGFLLQVFDDLVVVESGLRRLLLELQVLVELLDDPLGGPDLDYLSFLYHVVLEVFQELEGAHAKGLPVDIGWASDVSFILDILLDLK